MRRRYAKTYQFLYDCLNPYLSALTQLSGSERRMLLTVFLAEADVDTLHKLLVKDDVVMTALKALIQQAQGNVALEHFIDQLFNQLKRPLGSVFEQALANLTSSIRKRARAWFMTI